MADTTVPRSTDAPARAEAAPAPAAAFGAWRPGRESPLLLVGVGLALLVGFVVRARYVLTADFPLNDGALFLVMIEAMRAALPGLPQSVTYNGWELPFAYPPLAFASAALLRVAGVSAIDVLRFLPLFVNTLSIAAFALLARGLVVRPIGVVVGTLLFAVMPGSYIWQIMGGGLTRSFGFLFALLGLAAAVRLTTRHDRVSVALLSVCAALAALSHLEMAFWLAIGVAAAYLALDRTWEGLRLLVAAGLGAVMLTAPWWITVLVRYGPGPLLAASQTGSLLTRSPGEASALSDAGAVVVLVLAIAALGGLLALGDRALGLLAWMGLIILLDSRSMLWIGVVPFALAFGAFAGWLAGAVSSRARKAGGPHVPGQPASALTGSIVLGIVVGLAGWISTNYQQALDGFLSPLASAQREAMAWVAEQTPPASRFAIVTGDTWAPDRASEWFPLLAQRVSVATPQGTEWLPGGEFARRVDAHAALQACAGAGGACLAAWTRETGLRVSHVYIPRRPGNLCCEGLRAALQADPRFGVAYDGPGATIFTAPPDL